MFSFKWRMISGRSLAFSSQGTEPKKHDRAYMLRPNDRRLWYFTAAGCFVGSHLSKAGKRWNVWLR